jgi:serine/threonine protein kinase
MLTSSATVLADRYRLIEPIGSGGIGIVWRGHDDLLGRPVAVKEIRFPVELGAADRSRLVQRTFADARAAAALDTPAVVRVFDILEQDGRPWVVMELLEARTLTEVLAERGPLDPEAVAVLGLVLLDAVEAADRAGVVHGDIKPSNVLLTDEGRIALTDVAVATTDRADDEPDVVVGAARYLAPERANGAPASTCSDLWSLGATLWTAAEGRPPYDGATVPEVREAVACGVPPAGGRTRGALRDVLLGLLERDPDRRLSVASAREALAAVADGAAGVVAQPYPDEPRSPACAVVTPAIDRARVLLATPRTGAGVPAADDAEHPRDDRIAPLLIALAVVLVLGALLLSMMLGTGPA